MTHVKKVNYAIEFPIGLGWFTGSNNSKTTVKSNKSKIIINQKTNN